jgi:hypothetical protein
LPSVTPVTTPVVAFIVAIAMLLQLHTPPVVVLLSESVPPIQILLVGAVMAGTVGLGLTIIVFVTAFVQLLVLVTEYVIVVIPAAIPVSTPVAEIIAVVVLLLTQVPFAVVFDSVIVAPIQRVELPIIAAIVGNAFTVIVFEIELVQPLALVTE